MPRMLRYRPEWSGSQLVGKDERKVKIGGQGHEESSRVREYRGGGFDTVIGMADDYNAHNTAAFNYSGT